MTKRRIRYRRMLVPAIIVPALLVSSCGGDDEPASEPTALTNPGSVTPDVDDVEVDTDEQVVCNLLSDEEIAEATGFEVVAAEGNTMGLPMCEWELAIPESAGPTGLPIFQIVLLPERDYRTRVTPLLESLQDIDGPADEMKLHFVGGGDTDLPAMVTFFALKGTQGFQVKPGVEVWHDEAAATSALVALTGRIFDRM